MRPLAVIVVLILVACGGAGSVRLDPAMPDDVEVLAAEVVESVRAALPARVGCLEGLHVDSAWELDDRALYRPEDVTVVLRVPATAPRLTASLVHEIAHHLDAVCLDPAMRAAFLAAQGADQGIEWGVAPAWDEVPAEQFAGAVVEVVTGDPDLPRQANVTDEAVALVARWGSGEDPGHGSPTP